MSVSRITLTAHSRIFSMPLVTAQQRHESALVNQGICPDCGGPIRQESFSADRWLCVQYSNPMLPGCGWRGK